MSKRNEKNLHGILNLLKPPGMTSHDVVDVVRRRLGVRRVGHTGVLDPAAAGVLVLCVGNATRLADLVSSLPKVYRAEITFGITTDSYDGDGTVLDRRPAVTINERLLEDLLPQFTGDIQQAPPPQSAVHFQGKKLYEWNREQVKVVPQPRTVHVESLQIIHVLPGDHPRLLLEIACSKGTYVRSFAHELGQAGGCGAYLSFLVRKSVGVFHLNSCLTLEALQKADAPEQLLLPIRAAVSHLPAMILKDRGVSRVETGITLVPQDIAQAAPAEHEQCVALIDERGELVAIGEVNQVSRNYFHIRPTKVLRVATATHEDS